MQFKRSDWLFIVIIFLTTIVTVFDLFTNVGRPASMDGIIHITTAEMFYHAIRQGEFPVTWVDGFGNYGFPLGIIAQQFTSYFSAFFIFLVHNPVLAYNIVCFIGLLFSNIFFYLFLRIYFPQIEAFAATFLFNFAPYRIINLYVRGAIPEAFSNVFLPLILISLYYLVKKRSILALFGFTILIGCLALSHPMVLLIYAFIFIPYFLFLITCPDGRFSFRHLLQRENRFLLVGLLFGIILGLGIAGYYLLPLNLEIKYFYYGLTKNHLTPDQYMGFRNYFDPNWYYFTKSEIFPRGHVIEAGIIETLGVLAGVILLVISFIKRKAKYRLSLFDFAVATSLIVIFFTTKYANFFYTHINILSQIQFPWRMFTAFVFLPPIIYAYFLKKINNVIIVFFFILLICLMRFPQLYGKNYVNYPPDTYDFTSYNLHSTVMNTIWTGKTEDYPIEKNKIAIISGKGSIASEKIKNTSRLYQINAKTPLALVDYTFYFPGWHVFVDGAEVPIQFQDQNYRGVITYKVPQGDHTVSIRFQDTKVRKLGKIISLTSIILLLVLFFMKKRLSEVVFAKKLAVSPPTRV